jgi:hypothetical protein
MGQNTNAYLRYTNVTIPKNARIVSAIIKFRSYGSYTSNPVHVNIYVEAHDNPDAPTSQSDLDGRSVGSAVAWSSIPNWSAGSYYDTPDFASILETHFERTGWASGQALQIIIKDNGSSASRSARSHDLTPGDSAELIISYTLSSESPSESASLSPSASESPSESPSPS